MFIKRRQVDFTQPCDYKIKVSLSILFLPVINDLYIIKYIKHTHACNCKLINNVFVYFMKMAFEF